MNPELIPFTDIERELTGIVLRSEIGVIKNPRERADVLDQYATYILDPRKYSKIIRGIEKKDSNLDKLNQFYETYF